MKIIGEAGESYGLKVRSLLPATGEGFRALRPLFLNISSAPGSEPGSENALPGGNLDCAALGCVAADTLCICGHVPADHDEAMGCLANRGDCECQAYDVGGEVAPGGVMPPRGVTIAGYIPPIVTPIGNLLDLLASAGCGNGGES